MKISNVILGCCFFLVTFLVYHILLVLIPIAGGDYISFSTQNLSYWANYPFSGWDPKIDLGSSAIVFLGYGWFSFVFGNLGKLIGVSLVERLLWWIPFLLIGFFSSFFLARKILGKTPFAFFAPFLYLFNTYILLIIDGGQIAGIGIAYSIVPLFLLVALQQTNFMNMLLLGFTSSMLFLFDIRIWFIAFFSLGLYVLYTIISTRLFRLKKLSLYLLQMIIIPVIVTIFIHMQWFLPMVIVRQNPLKELGSAYTSLSAVKFFSFATFENAIGLLHPNWPDNIFGKVGFMKPEFLILPILAFLSLFFITKKLKEAKYLVFLLFLGIIGIFLAKGAQDPFGSIYLWLFGHVPGFGLFRDGTKWYLLIALSYSIAIPFTIEQIFSWIELQTTLKKLYLHYIFLVVIVLFLLFLVRQAFFGQLSGTFAPHPISQDYKNLSNYLFSQKQFSRVLWIPADQRFGFFSIDHPKVIATDFFRTTQEKSLQMLQKSSAESLLQEASIKYVIIPYDSEKEIFLKDRTYDEAVHQNAIKAVSSVPYLTKLSGFGRIAVFTLSTAKDHFFLENSTGVVNYTDKSPTEYIVRLENVKKGERLIFSETYNSLWIARRGETKIFPQLFDGKFNEYILPASGSYTITLRFDAQKWITLGVSISVASILFFLSLFFILWKRQLKMVQ